ncbi:VOC family protein [uncultured Dialister sp.]|jgi:catechol 2,3-dioxygenase-like lactoylglutathione lyase family enzyme|uniref:VOC family protein n=1 Tax=uncultured Dialister sp. TaxID=278064 RepID=UPI00260B1AE5|nr:VOC family protein [uncultured Dialister sp.]
MKLKNFDHIVLTTSHLEECLHFYRDFLGMTVSCENGRYALLFGSCKINIHRRPGEFKPAAAYPVSGSIDLCIITETPMEKVLSELRAKGAPVITDIVDRHGARGPMKSIYLRDPDGNLIEIARYIRQEADRNLQPDNDEALVDE